MAFDDQMKQRFLALMTERGVKLRCAVCGANDFGLGDKVVVLLGGNVESPTQSFELSESRGHPVVYLHCKHCFAVRLFDAASSGLLS